MRVSPTEPGPGDAPVGVPVDAPVPRPGNRGHDIEPVRPPVIARPAPPRPSGVLHLAPGPAPGNSGEQGKGAPLTAATWQDSIWCPFPRHLAGPMRASSAP